MSERLRPQVMPELATILAQLCDDQVNPRDVDVSGVTRGDFLLMPRASQVILRTWARYCRPLWLVTRFAGNPDNPVNLANIADISTDQGFSETESTMSENITDGAGSELRELRAMMEDLRARQYDSSLRLAQRQITQLAHIRQLMDMVDKLHDAAVWRQKDMNRMATKIDKLIQMLGKRKAEDDMEDDDSSKRPRL